MRMTKTPPGKRRGRRRRHLPQKAAVKYTAGKACASQGLADARLRGGSPLTGHAGHAMQGATHNQMGGDSR